jgi:DNA-directed RNA polymerase specialized sigma24 family protein
VISLRETAPEESGRSLNSCHTRASNPREGATRAETQDSGGFRGLRQRTPFELMTIFILRDLGSSLPKVAQIMGQKIDAVRRRQLRARKAIQACPEWPAGQ